MAVDAANDDGEGEQHDAAGERARAVGTCVAATVAGEAAGERPQAPARQRRPPVAQHEVDEAPREQAGSRPRAARGRRRPSSSPRSCGDTLRRERRGCSGPAGEPEHRRPTRPAAAGRRPSAANAAARRGLPSTPAAGDGGDAAVAHCRHDDAAAATARPTSAATATVQTTASAGVAPKRADPKASRPTRAATPSPSTPPATPTSERLDRRRATTCRRGAPRVRSSAWSRRRRSAPDAATAAVRSAGEDSAGKPEEQEQDLGVERRRSRAASSAAPRLSPTRPAPASRASRLRAAPVDARCTPRRDQAGRRVRRGRRGTGA